MYQTRKKCLFSSFHVRRLNTPMVLGPGGPLEDGVSRPLTF